MSLRRWMSNDKKKRDSVSGRSLSNASASSVGTAVSGLSIQELQHPETIREMEHEEILNNHLLRPFITPRLPYGDGSNKLFGFENFGTTCYCNSVLQCLYNTPEFRQVILEGSEPHMRNWECNAVKPRTFSESSFPSLSETQNSSSVSVRKNSSANGRKNTVSVQAPCADPIQLKLKDTPSTVILGRHATNIASRDHRKMSSLIVGPVLTLDYSSEKEPSLKHVLRELFETVAENKHLLGVVSPMQFVDTLKKENVLFSSAMHQDAHEFLNFLLNEVESGLFKGTLTNRVQCLMCENVTTREEGFMDIPVDVGQTLVDALKPHVEMLEGSNKFYCDKCCGLQEAERIVSIKETPQVLPIHLKRFQYSEEENCNVKLFNKMEYPLNIDISGHEYKLYGVVVHIGSGPQMGHYVAIVKNETYGWLLYDDETVETIDESAVLKFTGGGRHEPATAYVLFYKLCPVSSSAAASAAAAAAGGVDLEFAARSRSGSVSPGTAIPHAAPTRADTVPAYADAVRALIAHDTRKTPAEEKPVKRKKSIFGFK